MGKTFHKVFTGDARRMSSVRDGSVHLVVTSPPYWQLKDYGDTKQIGFNHSYEDYINNLNLVWSECRRVLRNGCRLCVNIGDQFARSVYYERYKVVPIKTEIIKFCETAGLDYMGTIIWQKKTTTNTTGGGWVMGSYPYPSNGIVKIDYESILIFKKTGSAIKRVMDKKIKEKSKLSNREWNTYFSAHWNFKGERQNGHIAMFPLELPSRLIKMFSFVGDTVLDPFLGSGTTCLSAINLGRNSIGYEINGDFLPVIRKKLGVEGSLLLTADVNFSDEKNNPLREKDCKQKISELPYIFKDAVKIERKIDPKKTAFENGAKKDLFYKVSEIVSPDKMRLSGGVSIKLIGIKTVEKYRADAIGFIRQKIKGRKVFMKFDGEKYDGEGNLLCYLYLDNKTFINAHLIKSGLVSVDRRTGHRHLNRFVKYYEEAANAGKSLLLRRIV